MIYNRSQSYQGVQIEQTFFKVTFIAPVMPLLHDDPNPMAETIIIDSILKLNGTSNKDDALLAESSKLGSVCTEEYSPFKAGTSTTVIMSDTSLERLD